MSLGNGYGLDDPASAEGKKSEGLDLADRENNFSFSQGGVTCLLVFASFVGWLFSQCILKFAFFKA